MHDFRGEFIPLLINFFTHVFNSLLIDDRIDYMVFSCGRKTVTSLPTSLH